MANAAKPDSRHLPVTSAAELRRILGPLNDDAAARILALRPSLEDLEVVALHAKGEGDRVDRLGHKLAGRAAAVFDILSREEEDLEDLARRA